ncbi:gene transfer agent family protein [Phreatobacter aquaticus]|uniref:Gene transfer agent family protein n=1 Tax=Phreatobacter aquaticus TaxID=2570229 RepID=A0A4D7QMY9_9HYPH|nr:gene transfer agent family protein [Phreatobacter aquaticus]QCK86634.1 gene transfer agent family protein [Phreatobacter aquaticus]
MANLKRGEIEADLGGTTRRLVLTLGALAELEAVFEAGSLIELAERFETGRLSAGDLIAVIAAGLRGAGDNLSDREVAALTVDGGAATYVRIVTDLLTATFGGGAGSEKGTASTPFPPAPAIAGGPPNPSPGTM